MDTVPAPTLRLVPANPGPPSHDEIQGYERLGKIGNGAMGWVYKGRKSGTDALVAIKMLVGGSADALDRHRREMEIGLIHPNIVRMMKSGYSSEKTPYIVMEYVAGGTLAEVIPELHADERGLNYDVIMGLAIELFSGLAFAHQKNFVHRDIKPSNILIQRSGGDLRVKIADFGIARHLDITTITPDGAVLGTPTYMSPEQGEGREVDFRSDLYSAGVVLYEMLAGQPPFRGSPDELREAHNSAEPPDLPEGVPRSLAQIVIRLLRKLPVERYNSTEEVVAELMQCRESVSTHDSLLELDGDETLDKARSMFRSMQRGGLSDGEAQLMVALATVARERGNTRALYLLGCIHEHERFADPGRARYYFELASQARDPKGTHRLALMEEDTGRRVSLLKKAAMENWGPATIDLAKEFERQGRDAEREFWLQRAYDRMDAEGTFELALFRLEKGYLNEAIKLLRQARARGERRAEARLLVYETLAALTETVDDAWAQEQARVMAKANGLSLELVAGHSSRPRMKPPLEADAFDDDDFEDDDDDDDDDFGFEDDGDDFGFEDDDLEDSDGISARKQDITRGEAYLAQNSLAVSTSAVAVDLDQLLAEVEVEVSFVKRWCRPALGIGLPAVLVVILFILLAFG